MKSFLTVGLSFPTVIILPLQCDRIMCKESAFAKISPFVCVMHNDMTKLPCGHIPALYIRSVVAHKLSADYAVGTAPENLVSVTHHHKLFTINRYSACSSDNIFLCALTLHHIGNSFPMIAFKLFQRAYLYFFLKSPILRSCINYLLYYYHFLHKAALRRR